MKMLKPFTAVLAAAGLFVSQAAAAQVAEPEVDEFGIPKAAQPLVLILGLVAVVVIVALLFEDDGNDSSSPASP